MTGTFNPAAHMMQFKGRDYLEVKWRLVWLRSEHPRAQVVTELVELGNGVAVFKATVTLPPQTIVPDGEVMWSGSATGYGMATSDEFADYMEKAETKALGRALAVLGYGTQFTGREIDEGTVVDSPATQPQRQNAQNARTGARSGERDTRTSAGITEPQRRKILALGEHVFGMTDDQVDEWVGEHFNGAVLGQLSRRDASALITAWEESANNR